MTGGTSKFRKPPIWISGARRSLDVTGRAFAGHFGRDSRHLFHPTRFAAIFSEKSSPVDSLTDHSVMSTKIHVFQVCLPSGKTNRLLSKNGPVETS